MRKLLEILIPLILIIVLLACILNDGGDGFDLEKNHDNNQSSCGGGKNTFTVGGLYEGFSAGEDGDDKTVKVTMVHADWCGFCKKAKPEWDKLVSEFQGKQLMGYKLHLQDLEEKRDKDKIKSEYPVKGFPTYFVEIDGNKKEFNSIKRDDMLDKIKKNISAMTGSHEEDHEIPQEEHHEMPHEEHHEMPHEEHHEMVPSKLPEPALIDEVLVSGCGDNNYGMARLKSVDDNLLFSGKSTNIMGYNDCTELEFAPIRVALQDTQPLKALPLLSNAQLPAPGIDAVSGNMRPASFEKHSNKEAHVTMVHANWCGFSKKAMPEWEKVSKKLKGSVLKGHKLIFRDLEQKRNEDEIKEKYSDVTGFPSYVVETKENGKPTGKKIFNGITEDAIHQGLNDSIN